MSIRSALRQFPLRIMSRRRYRELRSTIERLQADVATEQAKAGATPLTPASYSELRSTIERLQADIAAAQAKAGATPPPAAYLADSLAVWDKAVAFKRDPRFVQAYRRGMFSGHYIGRPGRNSDGDPETDIHIEWRVAICCWAARHAASLPGDFVECGVNTGIMSLAVCDYVDFNSTGKRFFLFDTFAGIPDASVSEEEREMAQSYRDRGYYRDCFDVARRNFAAFPSACLVRGIVPDSLGEVEINEVAYLCVDMNVAAPEVAALEHFWPHLTRGGVVVLDDYGWVHHAAQKRAIDAFAAARGVEVWELPTGQGLLIKP